MHPGIELANLSDVGCERTDNEDSLCYAEPEGADEFAKRGRLVVVADGMGGHQGGQMASQLATETVRDVFLHGDAADPSDSLIAAYQAAHEAILDYARSHPEYSGMGTTCTSAVLRDGQMFYGHVGDSRLYLVRDASIRRVTRDQSYVQQMIDKGLLTPEEAQTHPSRNVLLSALGSETSVEADFAQNPIPLQTGDVLLLCTDGLHGLVSEGEMLALSTSKPPRDACKDLVEMAKARGGFDNITVQILRIEGKASAK